MTVFNSYRLEELTQANGLDHGNAHDALSDVRATIALARLIRECQPKLFNFYLKFRYKKEAAQQLNLVKKKPVVHVSGMFGAARHCTAVVVPLAMHPINKNGIVVFDLSASPEILLDLSKEEIQSRLFTPAVEGQDRIALKVVHINKCPALAPVSVLRPEDQQRLGIDMALCLKNHQWLLDHPEVMDKVQQVFASPPESRSDDPDQMLYSGGFFSKDDKDRMDQIRSSEPSRLSQFSWSFEDSRLDEMLFRYRARHYPETLDADEAASWALYRKQRLTSDDTRILSFKAFWQAMEEARGMASIAQQSLLEELADYVRGMESSVG